MNRRGFLQSILASGVAPMIVGSGVLRLTSLIASPTKRELWNYGSLYFDALGRYENIRWVILNDSWKARIPNAGLEIS